MDYVTLEGIENRIGIKKENVYAFILKELLDNAVDFLERQYNELKNDPLTNIFPAAAAEVEVTILQEFKFVRIIFKQSCDNII
jgi:hypothetical protein